MAREATQMVIDELTVTRTSDVDILLSRDAAVPSAFTVDARLRRPPVALTFDVTVPAAGTAQVRRLAVAPLDGDPTLTAGMLRGIALDRLLRDALKEAQLHATQRPDIAPGAYQVEGQPADQFMVGAAAKSRAQQRSYEAAATAAQIYLDALRQGSRAPAEAVVAKMDRSRGQVARYIRLARESNLLPPIGVPLDEWTPPQTSSAVWRGQLVPLDELEEQEQDSEPQESALRLGESGAAIGRRIRETLSDDDAEDDAE